MKRFLCLILALALLLAGCEIPKTWSAYTAYADMQYTRPDMAAMEAALDAACAAAENALTVKELENRIWEFYDAFDLCYTNYNYAFIQYCLDVTDPYWQEEYAFCAANIAKADAGLDTLYRALAQSPFRSRLEEDDYFGADFFVAYEGESQWDETFMTYLEQEVALEEAYYSLCEDAATVEYYSQTFFEEHTPAMAQVFLELVQLRQEMAAYLGYDSYPEFAYDFYYSRDYTPAQATAYFETVGKQMASLYRRLEMPSGTGYSTPEGTLDYLRQGAKAMGGGIAEAFSLMDSLGLHHILPGENKYDLSFEVYLDSYRTPFLFMNPTGTDYDKLILAHEFGHFVNDYLCVGSYAGADIAEIHSQTMEYLSLCYGQDTNILKEMKLADSVCVYVEQSAYALFEHRVYDLKGEELTLENIQNLYTEIGVQFGFNVRDWDYRDYVLITHLYTEPMYMASYVASNDVAFQIYRREVAAPGEGLKLYQQILKSEDSYLMAFVEAYGLEDPFDPARVAQICRALDPMMP